jgi:pentatricopeptide repeat protein
MSASKQPTSKATNDLSLDQTFIRRLNSQLFALQQSLDPLQRDTELDTANSFELLQNMLSYYSDWQTQHLSNERDTVAAATIVDRAFHEMTTHAFSNPYTLDKVQLGMMVLKLQLHPPTTTTYQGNNHHKPFHSVPRGTWLKALRALTSSEINSSRSTQSIPSTSKNDQWITPANASFQILQRFITKIGVRTNKSNQHHQHLDERDFNMVLHAYASTNQMHSAHKVMALQERTPNAPPLSNVAYSILLKAYGRKRDVKNVEICLGHAQRNGVVLDIVMANTVLDAYVNCGWAEKAEILFQSMSGEEGDTYWPRLRPNVRTYNTLLKGMSYEGRIKDAMKLSNTMLAQDMWDDITTNTLVNVAVTAQEFEIAEQLLANHTSSHSRNKHQRDHPNVEAYTELIDGYAKDGQLEKALEVMTRMQSRHVSPNEYTYTCIVGALARNNKVRQAKKMMDYVSGLDFPSLKRGKRRVLTPVFNAFISGLLSGEGEEQQQQQGQASHSLNILEALNTLSEMERMDVHPNVVTVTLLIDGLANCNPPRCKEAKELVQHLEYTIRSSLTRQSPQYNQGVSSWGNDFNNRISLSNAKIGTAMIRAYGRANDVDSAMDAFRRIAKPDVVALNALLDACCKSSKLKLAFETFDKYASFEKWSDDTPIIHVGPLGDETKCKSIQPDVVTYTILIAAVLQLQNKNASKRAAQLYDDMKKIWRISPDTVLVDK